MLLDSALISEASVIAVLFRFYSKTKRCFFKKNEYFLGLNSLLESTVQLLAHEFI